jgi:hypothetical protein
MYIYALVSEASENNLGVILQHSEKRNIGELWKQWEEFREENRYSLKPIPDFFSDWLVKEHGFEVIRAIVFNTDTKDEWEQETLDSRFG